MRHFQKKLMGIIYSFTLTIAVYHYVITTSINHKGLAKHYFKNLFCLVHFSSQTIPIHKRIVRDCTRFDISLQNVSTKTLKVCTFGKICFSTISFNNLVASFHFLTLQTP
ncbi:hypothetical protein C1H46_023352 [Malus baccata]|uniref:Uncharacterized protein n=1 Tax=Malus baccata TaxID=106549 RepID=A0A540LXB6_MALBA|nr:hypothetical protein C1H46_023352 [Malus baccata]